jgi:Tol biopolymer transport system component
MRHFVKDNRHALLLCGNGAVGKSDFRAANASRRSREIEPRPLGLAASGGLIHGQHMWRIVVVSLAVLGSIAISRSAEPDGPAQEATFLQNPRQLIYEGRRSGEGYFRPDGQQLIFQSEREPGNPFFQIYILDLMSGETHRVSPGIGKTTCAFFQPASSRVIFASTHLDPDAAVKMKAEFVQRAAGPGRRYSWDYDETYDIFSCESDGSDLRRLTDSRGYDAEGSFSPDGRKIVFSSVRAAYSGKKLTAPEQARLAKDPAYFADIYIMNADGSGVQQLTETPGYDGGPFFTADGEHIVWRRFDVEGLIADVYTMRTDGTEVHRVTDFQAMSWAPFAHSSGAYFIFTSNKLGFDNFELFLVDFAGAHEPVRVSFTPGFDGLPVFSPDGKKLCWTTNRGADKRSQLFLADWNHDAAMAALRSAPPRAAAAAPRETSGAKVEKTPPPNAPANFSLSLAPEISAADAKSEVSWLAAPEREGRMTGSTGARASAEWLAAYFRGLSLAPLGGDFLEPFEFNAGVKIIPKKNELSVNGRAFVLDKDYRPLSFSETASVEGEVVFAGYGLSVPEEGGARYNSYERLDVKDKVVLILRFVPEGVEPPRRAQLNRYAGLRYKAMLAREHGAKAVLCVTGPNSPQAGELIGLSGDNTLAGSGIVAHSITIPVADALLAKSGQSLKSWQTALDTENPHAAGGLVLAGIHVKTSAGIEHIRKNDSNVVACLPPAKADGESAHPDDSTEYVVIGAHYDHLGHGDAHSSMARAGEEGKIHPGADDNASGTAAVMEIAASLAKQRAAHPEKFQRGVLFALWSGEEMGVIGSAAFCEKPPVPREKIAAYLNFDMVGRLRENKLTVQGVGSSTVWKRLIEKRNVAAGFNLVLQDDPYLPTDVTNFYPRQIPVLNFFTGAHEDYHRPTDTPEKIDYEGLARVAKFAEQIALDLISAPERPPLAKVEKSDQAGGGRETLRAYLGTIPDYGTDVKGVKLSGVRGGSPAEKGGLQSGDIIVEFAGQKIVNIYDYTYALDAVKIGQPVKMVIMREGKRVELTVTPEARK